eukprot:TRINITY_DN1275_c0_g4_i1.p1 TRINITY_DN1275_c0_g4~~TRINITY_DN1275_c0_g4_i1.p1  ORF type:complete len:615 (-),score=148.99 TRINITY_DN1275_c0_g4_i1:1303-3147(-)
MATHALTENVISTIAADVIVPNPILQILQIKQLPSGSFQCALSDGRHYCTGVLVSQLSDVVTQQGITANTIVRLDQYLLNKNGAKRFVMIQGLTFLENMSSKIGTPSNLDAAPASASTAGPAAISPVKPAVASYPASSYESPVSRPSAMEVDAQPLPVAKESDLPSPVVPVGSLNPYQNRWTIKARVTKKSDMRHFNARTAGKLFNVDLLDESGTEIRATMFNEAADKWFHVLQPDRVYYFGKGSLKMAQRKFSNINNAYEISFDANAFIAGAPDDIAIKKQSYTFVPLASLGNLPAQKDSPPVDILAVVVTVKPVDTIVAKATMQTILKREVTITDQDRKTVVLTLWNKNAQNSQWDELLQSGEHPVIAIKSAKLGEFGGRSLSTYSGSDLQINPDLPEARELAAWYGSEGTAAPLQQLVVASASGEYAEPERKSFGEVADENIGASSTKFDRFTVRAYVQSIRKDSPSGIWYQACPSETCKKKVAPVGSQFYCAGCQKNFDTCSHRYIMSLSASDSTGLQWMNAFDEQAAELLGVKADEMAAWKETGDARYESTLDGALLKQFVFRVKSKSEEYTSNKTQSQETRVRHQIYKATPVDFVAESKQLLKAIAGY